MGLLNLKKNKFIVISIIILCLFLYLIIDEEPLVDFTDLNVIQVITVLFSVSALILDNIIRFFYGQGLLGDKNLFVYAYFYTNNLFIYLLIIWGFFYSHHITPLNISNVDLNLYFIKNLNNYSFFFLYATIIVLFYNIIIINNTNKIFTKKSLISILIANLILTYNLIFSLFDFLFTSVSSTNKIQFNGLNFNNKYSLTYDVKDSLSGFEWHLAESRVQSISLLNSMSILGSLLTLSYLLFFTILIIFFLINNLKKNIKKESIIMQISFIKELSKNILLYVIYSYLFIFFYSIFCYICVNNSI